MFKTKFESGCMLVLGGAKRGKSRFALNLCNSFHRKRIFLATAQALDPEMKERIKRHQKERGGDWVTVEEPINIGHQIRSFDSENTVILIDCLTLWLNNLYMQYDEDQESIWQTIEDLLSQLSIIRGALVIVSNEVGMGIVPDNSLARRYRDDVGSANQRIAQIAQKVVAVMAGIPLALKDE
jgi:adenosylcobinamide kinase/adenosylcobinamide-phosphate guanylyltransferase